MAAICSAWVMIQKSLALLLVSIVIVWNNGSNKSFVGSFEIPLPQSKAIILRGQEQRLTQQHNCNQRNRQEQQQLFAPFGFRRQFHPLCMASKDQDLTEGEQENIDTATDNDMDNDDATQSSFRKRVKNRLTKVIVAWSGSSSTNKNNAVTNPRAKAAVDEAFGPAEESIRELEDSLVAARTALANAKSQTYQALAAAMEEEESKGETINSLPEPTVVVESSVTPSAIPQISSVNLSLDTSSSTNDLTTESDDLTTEKDDLTTEKDDNEEEIYYTDLESLRYEDIDYESSEMAPPFLDGESCLMPDAEPLVRVEKAPDNSRRIFAGIDILASADDVWNILTNYHELQNVIPNLVVNDVLELYDARPESDPAPLDFPEEDRCAIESKSMKGSLLRQVGGAKVAGINFSAKTTLEVREWPRGMPDFAHFMDDMWEGKSREERAQEYPKIKLKRYRFPRPFCVSKLPTKDISMQSIENDDGEFRMYQGVWRMQPLVGCAPPGKDAMRLTYAVEISPRVYLPVKLIEGRIVRDLCANLEAIRSAVTETEPAAAVAAEKQLS